MIPQIKVKAQKTAWQTALKEAITDPLILLNILNIPCHAVPWIQSDFSLKVPVGFAAKMKKGDPDDPLLKQILPVEFENEHIEGFTADPLKERDQNPLPGLIHKFKHRVLVMPAARCPVHCRYCFRRHFPYETNNPNLKAFDDVAAYIKNDPDIHEIILSGSDPLYAPDHYLTAIVDKFKSIPHIRILRFHTRFPITIPERIDDGFLDFIKGIPFQVVMVLHCNHPNELCQDIKTAISKLKSLGVIVLNQSVLLKGVNDSIETLTALSYRLFEHGILPYYVNRLDQVAGSGHFSVTLDETLKIYKGLLATLPGYLVPRFVQEQAFAPNKIPLPISTQGFR